MARILTSSCVTHVSIVPHLHKFRHVGIRATNLQETGVPLPGVASLGQPLPLQPHDLIAPPEKISGQPVQASATGRAEVRRVEVRLHLLHARREPGHCLIQALGSVFLFQQPTDVGDHSLVQVQ